MPKLVGRCTFGQFNIFNLVFFLLTLCTPLPLAKHHHSIGKSIAIIWAKFQDETKKLTDFNFFTQT